MTEQSIKYPHFSQVGPFLVSILTTQKELRFSKRRHMVLCHRVLPKSSFSYVKLIMKNM